MFIYTQNSLYFLFNLNKYLIAFLYIYNSKIYTIWLNLIIKNRELSKLSQFILLKYKIKEKKS